MDHTTIYPPLSRWELDGAAISKKAAKDGMVLLRNRAHALPLTPGAICLFGNGAVRTVRGGTGSGDPFNGGLSGGGDVHVEDGGRTIVYRVKDAFRQTICRGDVQRCAANNLKVMLRLDRHL